MNYDIKKGRDEQMSPGMEVDKWIAVHEWVIGPNKRYRHIVAAV